MAHEEGLPGSLELAMAVKKAEWPHTLDASIWAKKFMEHFQYRQLDEADMIGWFANAIMAGHDQAILSASKSTWLEATRQAYEDAARICDACLGDYKWASKSIRAKAMEYDNEKTKV